MGEAPPRTTAFNPRPGLSAVPDERTTIAKKILGYIKLQVPAGAATPSPPMEKRRDAPHEDVVHLLCRFPHRSGRGHDSGLDRVAFQLPAAKLVYRGLIESDHRA